MIVSGLSSPVFLNHSTCDCGLMIFDLGFGLRRSRTVLEFGICQLEFDLFSRYINFSQRRQDAKAWQFWNLPIGIPLWRDKYWNLPIGICLLEFDLFSRYMNFSQRRQDGKAWQFWNVPIGIWNLPIGICISSNHNIIHSQSSAKPALKRIVKKNIFLMIYN